MFGHRYFGRRYFAARYFGDGGSSAAPDPGGGGTRKRRLGTLFSMLTGLVYNRLSTKNP